jgi:hypothetical protein
MRTHIDFLIKRQVKRYAATIRMDTKLCKLSKIAPNMKMNMQYFNIIQNSKWHFKS